MPVKGSPPPGAEAVFGSSLRQARRYAELLTGPGIERGLIGPAERDRLWERHLFNSAALAPLLPPDGVVADVGSGAGLPGVVLALVRPDVRFRLIEPQRRRVVFLTEVVDDLELGNVEVVQARAEEEAARQTVGGRGYDAVVARAVASLERLITLGAPLLRPGGEILALKGAKAAAEVAAAQLALHRVSGHAEVLERYLPDGAGTATVVRVVVQSAVLPVPPRRHRHHRPATRSGPPARPR